MKDLKMEDLLKTVREMQAAAPPRQIIFMDQSIFDDIAKMEMSLVTQEPQFDRIEFRTSLYGIPVVRVPNAIVMNSFDCGPDESDNWEFMYLFPLGVKAFKKKSRS